MKTHIFTQLTYTFLFLIISNNLFAQGIGINNDNSDPDASAMLDVKSTSKGMLVPRLTTGQRTTIAAPATGLLVFDNTTGSFWFFDVVWTELQSGTDNDNQDLALAGNTLSLTNDGTTVNLSGYLDNTDNQDLSLAGNTLSLTNDGTTVNLSGYLNTDNQDLSLAGNTLSLTNDGTTVDLSGFLDADNLGNHNATTTLDLNSNPITEVSRLITLGTSDYDKLRVYSSADYTIGMHSAMSFGYLNDWSTTFTMNQDDDRGWVWRDANDAQSDGAASLTTNGRFTVKSILRSQGTLLVDGVATISSLSGTGSRMVVANAAGLLSTQAIAGGDITGVTAGTGLTGGGAAGTVTLNAVGTNGLTTTANDIRLGGTLIEATTIAQGINNMAYNLNSTGDFHIQDNGINHFSVSDNGNTAFGGDVEWRDENTGGTLLAQLFDDGDDGRFIIMENGAVSVDLDANTQFVFNQQGFDRNFTIESNTNANMFFLDAGTNRIGVGTNTPTQMLQVNGDSKINTALIIGAPTTYGNHLLTVGAATNAGIKFGHTGGYNDAQSGRLSFEENIDNQTTVGTFCGFEWHHDGAANEFYLSSGCTASGIRMSVERGGQIGISTDNPTANLSVNGTANKTGGGTWAVFSDARLKQDVSTYTEGLDFIKQVRTVNFTYNDKMDEIWGENAATKGKIYQGVIAQELQKIAPDMVNEVVVGNEVNPEDLDFEGVIPETETYLEVDPNKFTYALINAVKEQQGIIDALKVRQNTTQKELEEIKALLKKINK